MPEATVNLPKESQDTTKKLAPATEKPGAQNENQSVSIDNGSASSTNESRQPPPPLPASYRCMSPLSTRKSINPASISRQITAHNPIPQHFNRPPPNSPVLIRKNRNPSPAKSQSIVSNPFRKMLSSNVQVSNTVKSFENTQCSRNNDNNDNNNSITRSSQPSSNNATLLQCTKESGQGAKPEQIIPTTFLHDSSLSEASNIGASSEAKTNTTIASNYKDEKHSKNDTKDMAFEQPSQPWLVTVNTTRSTSVPVGARPLSPSQAPWRARREHQDSCSSSTSDSHSTTSSDFNMNTKSSVQIGIQQHSQEAPWRSPQPKRKDVKRLPTTQQSSNVKTSSVNIKTESMKQVPAADPTVNKPVEVEQVTSSVTSSVSTKSKETVTTSSNVVSTSVLASNKDTKEQQSIKTDQTKNFALSSASSNVQEKQDAKMEKTPNKNIITTSEETAKIKSEVVTITADTVKFSSNENESIKKAGTINSETSETSEKTVLKEESAIRPEQASIPPPPPPPPEKISEPPEKLPEPQPQIQSQFQSQLQPQLSPSTESSSSIEPQSLPPSGQLLHLQHHHMEESQEEKEEYKRVPVTRRIQKFEKQSSIEHERRERTAASPARPVGPWVKKTSTGPVTQETWDPQDSTWVTDSAFMDTVTSRPSRPRKPQYEPQPTHSSSNMKMTNAFLSILDF